MAKEKKSWRRKSYLDDFQKTASGEYVYNGALHSYAGEGLSRTRALTVLWMLTLAVALSALGSGFVSAPGSVGCFYVVLPNALAIVMAGSLVWLMCRLTAGGDPMRDYVYKATVAQFKPRGCAAAAISAAAVGGELVYLLLHGPEGKGRAAALYLLFQSLESALALGWVWWAKRLKWSK